jgi:hypothetical protein
MGLHLRARAIDDTQHASLADEHVVRLFGEHEARRAAQRIERALSEREQLVLAVAIGEEREHEKREPIGAGLVECTEQARLVCITAAALEQGLSLFAPVTAEVRVEQKDHRPEVPALFDVHLEQVTEIIHGWAGLPEQSLLLDACGFRVSLRDDQAPERVAMLAGHLLPHGLAVVVSTRDGSVLHGVGEEDSPAIVRHLHVVEVRPALRIDAGGGTQVHVVVRRAFGAHVFPPVDVVGLPGLERALQLLVVREVDVIRDLVVVDDLTHGCLDQVRRKSNSARSGLP